MFGRTPLHHACRINNLTAIKFIMDKVVSEKKQIDINALSTGGQTPLMKAVEGGNIHIISILLEANADLTIKDS